MNAPVEPLGEPDLTDAQLRRIAVPLGLLDSPADDDTETEAT
ncbi:hypothetical protein [Streptomyces microflavus]